MCGPDLNLDSNKMLNIFMESRKLEYCCISDYIKELL